VARLREATLVTGLALVAASFCFYRRRGSAVGAVCTHGFPSVEGLGMALLLPWASTVISLGLAWWTRVVEHVARWSYGST